MSSKTPRPCIWLWKRRTDRSFLNTVMKSWPPMPSGNKLWMFPKRRLVLQRGGPLTRKKKLPAQLAARRLDSYFDVMAANQEKRDAADVELMDAINEQKALIQTAVDDACMAIDASAISDPMRRAYILKRQKTIMERN
ncbi:unnamed protein product [Rhizopus stolonifer]